MPVYSIIQKSQLEGALRLDAEYYQPEYLELENKIKLKNWDYLGNLVIFNRRGIQPKYSELVMPYKAIISQNILEDFLDVDNLPSVEENFFNSIQSQLVKLKQYDILVYTTGANIGRTNIFYPNNVKAIASNHVNIIRSNPDKINQLYLGLFLQSKIGRSWFNRWASGSDQEEIYPDDLSKFPVFIPNVKTQSDLTENLIRSFKLLEESRKIYSKAENLLLEELGLKDFKPEEELSFVVNLSDIKSAHRADAEYFQPKYEKIISKIKNQNAKLLGDLVSMKKGIEPGSEVYQEEGKLFIRVSNLSKHGLVEKDQKYLTEVLYQRLKKDFEPKTGEILLTKDATPGIAYVVKEPIEGIISSGILRLKLKEEDIENEYLALCLNSVIGQMQAERDGGGSIITHWKPEQIKNVLIPILPKSTQQKIADLVKKSHEAYKQAKELLEEAKNKIENLIKNS